MGGSSVKYKLYDMSNETEITSGGVEKVGLPDSFLKFKKADGEKVIIERPDAYTKGGWYS